MSKIVEIFYCGDCPYRFFIFKGNDMCCELMHDDRVINENEYIPDWCPLDDKYIEKNFHRKGMILSNNELQELVTLLIKNLQCPCGCAYEMSLNEPCACNWNPVAEWFDDRDIEFKEYKD